LHAFSLVKQGFSLWSKRQLPIAPGQVFDERTFLVIPGKPPGQVLDECPCLCRFDERSPRRNLYTHQARFLPPAETTTAHNTGTGARRALSEERSCTAVKQGFSLRSKRQLSTAPQSNKVLPETTNRAQKVRVCKIQLQPLNPKTRNNTTQVQDTTVLESQPLPGDRRLHGDGMCPVRKLPAHINAAKTGRAFLARLGGRCGGEPRPLAFAKEPVGAAG